MFFIFSVNHLKIDPHSTNLIVMLLEVFILIYFQRINDGDYDDSDSDNVMEGDCLCYNGWF